MDWHKRYLQQASWTRDIRSYLFGKSRLESAHRILEVGCGTGALLDAVERYSRAAVYGIDISSENLRQASSNTTSTGLAQADAHHLPFETGSFDASFCHFVLLWVANPQAVVEEMKRVVRPGGSVLLIAEPDYGGRIDYPAELEDLGRLQVESLRAQGADPYTGRKLAAILNNTGLQKIETGILSSRGTTGRSPEDIEIEWQVLSADLSGGIPEAELDRLRKIDASAWEKGERVLFVPTFYGYGEKP